MIKFKEKTYSEYDAMRELYNELSKYNRGEGSTSGPRIEAISKSYLPGILKGNSVVVEKFTITTKLLGRDRYRMYIKIGSKAKMPDEVRLPKSYYDENLINASLVMGNAFSPAKASVGSIGNRTYSDGGGNKKNKQSGGLKFSIQNTVSKILADSILYDKKQRLLVLELDSVYDAAKALNVLPFGLGYKLYLLD